MDKVSLEQKINLILDNVLVEKPDNYVIARNQQNYINRSQDEEIEVENAPEDIDFVNKQVCLLKKLYRGLGSKERAIFREILLKKTIEESMPIANTAFNTLIHINLFDEVFPLVTKSYKSYDNNLVLSQLKLLTSILKNEWNIFTIPQIQKIYDWVNKTFNGETAVGKDSKNYPSLYREHINIWGKLFRQTNTLLVKDLDSRLESGLDLEVAADQESLTNEFKRYGFDDNLEKILEKIDGKLSLDSDSFDYKNCMDLIRSFTERLYEQIARTIRIQGWKSTFVKDSEKVAKYFKESGLITGDEVGLLTSLRHFLSNKGSHRLKSKLEDARLSRNMTIEFSLYLMRRLEVLIKTQEG